MLVTYWNLNKNQNEDEFCFNQFKTQFIFDSKSAKNHFEGLRKLQKTFEDLYKKFDTYNFLGIILKTCNNKDKETALQYFLSKQDKISIEDYAKWSLVGSTHLEILNDVKEKNEEGKEILIKKRKAYDAIELINNRYVYSQESTKEKISDRRLEFSYEFLMLLNLLEDHKLERKFDFTIWNNRSLEHIYPKSKEGQLDFTKDGCNDASIHCIGNLVLLYGRDNSVFGAKDVTAKKEVYFKMEKGLNFKSRSLLHSLSVFANSKWEEEQIAINKKQTVNHLNEYYGI